MRDMFDKDDFVRRAQARFGVVFDYEDFEYKNAKTKSVIVCRTHGAFHQTPEKHLTSKYGCPACWQARRSEVMRGKPGFKTPTKTDMTEIQARLVQKFGMSYSFDLTECSSATLGKVTVTCPVHGPLPARPVRGLLFPVALKQPCLACSNSSRISHKTAPAERVRAQLAEKYRGKYSYDLTGYRNKRSKISITCPHHGTFVRSAQKHFSGHECPKCTLELLISSGQLPGGYCATILKRSEALANSDAWLYYLKLNDGEAFKIGVTRISVAARIKGIRCKAGGSLSKIEILFAVPLPLKDAVSLEQKILEDYKTYRVTLHGSTECFSFDVLTGTESEEFERLENVPWARNYLT